MISKSYSSVHIHLIFSTQDRFPYMSDADFRAGMHSWLGGVSRKNNCPPVIIGGTADHVHLLGRLGNNISVSGWVKELKRASNIWAKRTEPTVSKFSWQSGYGSFAVSKSNVRIVKDYIQRQEEHHRKMSFMDEFKAILRKHGMEWDENDAGN